MIPQRHFRIDTTLADRTTVWIDVENRSMNVLFEEVFEDLQQLIDTVVHSTWKLPIVFRSAKKKGFVVGADLRRILAIQSDQALQTFLLQGQLVFSALERLALPTIALLEGPCLGGGLEFALACRHRIACNSPSTQLGMPEAKLGLMPGWGGTQRLIERIGIAEGTEMLLGGDPVDAPRALKLGLVDALIEPSEVELGIKRALDTLASRASFRRSPAEDESSTLRPFDSQPALTPSQLAIQQAIRIGRLEGRENGFRAERELFFALLSSSEVQTTLQRFASPSRPSV